MVGWFFSGLPGEHAELQRQDSADGHSFQQGDKVKCLLEVDILRQMQEGHGGWNPKMAEVFITPHFHTYNSFFFESRTYLDWRTDICTQGTITIYIADI